MPVVKYYGKGNYHIKLHANSYISRKYGYANSATVAAYHGEKLHESDFSMIAPLLESQPYINKVIAETNLDMIANYNLDSFRSVLWRTFYGNYLEGYFKTFLIPYSTQDVITPWLVAEPKPVAQIVVARTLRHRDPNSVSRWKDFTSLPNFKDIAVFVGHDDEYEDFKQTLDVTIPRYVPKDFLDLAQVISGAEHVISNGTFVYSLAQGLGKSTTLETLKDRTLANNECYFPREDCFYF